MSDPDSTIEFGMFPKINFSPHPKRQRKDDRYASFLEVFPQKSIKWRSPLVYSPAEKFSPQKSELCFDFGRKEANRGNNGLLLGIQDATSSSMNSTPSDIFEKPLIDSSTGKGGKNKSKLQLPLTDEGNIKEENESFNRKAEKLDDISNLEYFGPPKRNKEQSANSSASYASKYYNQLLINSQRESEHTVRKLEDKTQNKSVTSSQVIEDNLPVPQNEQLLQDNFMAPADNFQVLETRQKEPIPSEYNSQNYYNPELYSQRVPMEYYHNRSSSIFSGRSCVENNDAVPSARKPNPDDCLLNANFTDKYFNRHNFNPYFDQRRFTIPAIPYFHHSSLERPDVLPQAATSAPCFCMCCGHRPRSHLGVNPYHDPYVGNRIEPKHFWNHFDNIPYRNNLRACQSRCDDISEEYIDNGLQQLDEQPLRLSSSLPYSNYKDHKYFLGNAQIPEYCPSTISNLNCEATERKENANPHIFYQNQPSLKYVEDSFDPNINNTHRHGNRLQEPQTPKRNVSQVFAPTPKRVLKHSPKFNFIANKKPTFPKNVHVSASQPIGAQKRLLNFQSFEERLDNMILPRNQGYSFAATRGRRHVCQPPSGYNSNCNENGDREFVMNSFLAENNQHCAQ